MKVSLGMNLKEGAWGGGNQFGKALVQFLKKKNIEVSFDLKASNLDICLLVEPDSRLGISAYSNKNIQRYLSFRNSNCIVVHRINNTSEARNDQLKRFNKYRIAANKVADHTVFVSQWVHDIYVESGFISKDYSIIQNGAPQELWFPNKQSEPSSKKSLVTHHWSDNPLKGFDIYIRLDEMLKLKKWSDKISFTYIGNLPEGIHFETSNYYGPMSGNQLVKEIQRHDIYLTASRNEAGPMHCIEGALCGSPLLFIKSGSLPEYCNGFGVSFTLDTFEEKLEEMLDTYDYWVKKMSSYPHTSEKMCNEYYILFQKLLDNREHILSQRKPTAKASLVEKTSYKINEVKDSFKKLVPNSVLRRFGSR